MPVPFMFVDGNVTLVLNGKSFQVLPDHVNYRLIMEALPTATADELLNLVEIKKALSVYSCGRVTADGSTVKVDGEEVHGSISKRILEFMRNGLPVEPLLKFLDNLSNNPSMQSQKELYDFLEHESLPITEDGHFLAYKAVRSDYKDKYRGVFDNTPGNVCEMARAKVDDDRSRGCSDGLHAGALNYVATYGCPDAGDKIVIVKINPADVVSVPSDCNCEKLRTARYEVVDEYKGELVRPLYEANLDDGVDYDDSDDLDYEVDEEYWDDFEDSDEDSEDDYEEDYSDEFDYDGEDDSDFAEEDYEDDDLPPLNDEKKDETPWIVRWFFGEDKN